MNKIKQHAALPGYLMLDDDAMDAAVRDDLEQEMNDDGLKKHKRKKTGLDLARHM